MVNHGFIETFGMSARERAEIGGRFEALEARVEALENKESHDTGENSEDVERPPADVEFRRETSWQRPDYYPGDWTVVNGVVYDAFYNVVDEPYLKEFGFRKRSRWVSEWRDL